MWFVSKLNEENMQENVRQVNLKGCKNTRDLGGVATMDGKTVACGKIFRSGALRKLTKKSSKKFKRNCGITTLIDLRTFGEREHHPVSKYLSDVPLVHIPIIKNALIGITDDNVSGAKKMKALFQSGMSEQEYMYQTYFEIVSDVDAQKGFKKMFDVLLEKEEGASVYFCSHGRDRTGIATMLIYTALGVDEETILQDYLIDASKETKRMLLLIKVLRAVRFIDKSQAEFSRDFAQPSLKRLLHATTWIKENYGTIMNYLHQAIGLTEDDVAKLKQKYLV